MNIGLYILNKLKILGLNIGLYRDDGLGVSNATNRQFENIKKQLCAIFRQEGLSITVETNLKEVNFFNVTLDLRTGLYRPYIKPNDTPPLRPQTVKPSPFYHKKSPSWNKQEIILPLSK